MRKKTTLRFKTLILSDVHLGTPECRVKEVNDVLKHVDCDKLILNGDIIDGWSLRRKGGWSRAHTRFVRLVLKKADKKKVDVVYVAGNHDEVLRTFLPVTLHRLRIVEEHVHETPRGRYLVVHGDVFDVVTRHHRFLAVLGSIGYQGLIRLNRLYNFYRSWRGREYFSLSKKIKARVKNAVNFVSRFEEQIHDLATKRGCVGVICGHIHTPADKRIGEIHYLNSGDWVESMTALVEHDDGRFEVLGYDDFRRRLVQRARERLAAEGPRRRAIGAAPRSVPA
jgi:UDP-2,3-diacylglucosamine pyrophosphatase LpxH